MADPILTRRHSWKSLAGPLAGSILLGALFVVAAVLSGLWFLGLLAPLPPAAVLVWGWVRRAGSSYRVYADRVEMEQGVLSRRIENVELFRVRDLGVKQGFLGRLFDFGEVYVHSTDASAPDVVLADIDHPREFYQTLRDLVTESRAHRQTMIVEEGRSLPPGEA